MLLPTRTEDSRRVARRRLSAGIRSGENRRGEARSRDDARAVRTLDDGSGAPTSGDSADGDGRPVPPVDGERLAATSRGSDA